MKRRKDNRETHWSAIASLICGIVGLFAVPLLGSLLAIIFGIITLHKIRKHPKDYKGKGLAMPGIILGVVGLIFYSALIFFMIWMIHSIESTEGVYTGESCDEINIAARESSMSEYTTITDWKKQYCKEFCEDKGYSFNKRSFATYECSGNNNFVCRCKINS